MKRTNTNACALEADANVQEYMTTVADNEVNTRNTDAVKHEPEGA